MSCAPVVRRGEYAARGDYHRDPDPDWDYYPTYIAKLETVRAWLRALPAQSRVLDAGCGEGVLVDEFADRLAIEGLDPNYSSARVRSGSVLALPYPDASFDRALCLDVLEHLYDPWRALTRIRGWVASGTRVLASVPNIRNLVNLHELAGGAWEYGPHGVLDITHVRFFTRGSLRRLFEETGYAVTRMEPLTQPAWVDRYVIARRPGKVVTRNISIAFRDREDLEDLYAFQYVVDARASTAANDGVAVPHAGEPGPIV